ncbi:MAG: PAS domain-containing protein [Candidatus Marinimicrobia bacterium]|nr:PAS domain-containing protein [Candidatus Neomarinimicrobiota bacterium]
MELNHIVCIGASAGGLEALESFFLNMPSNSNLAFVVIQHLSPDYKSLMQELLSKKTEMVVKQVKDDTAVLPNHVYLIPPGNNLKIKDSTLYLVPKDKTTLLNLPIDIFMKSLALDQGDKSIGIILSGTGSDGMQGIRSIKEAGGMVMVQDQDTAKFDGMPKSALSTGLVDFVLAPEDMPEHLIAYLNHPLIARQMAADQIVTDEDNLAQIFTILSRKKNIDFTQYKRSTLMRRIQRRLSVNHIRELSDYVNLLNNSENEVNILQREFLIGVTNFFRDKEVFQKLENKYIPEIVKRTGNSEIRVWVAGCSSGEEAYSIAILFLEAIENQKTAVNLKIFATDIDHNAIFRAGQGLYPESVAVDIDPNHLHKYFIKKDDQYQIIRKVRESVIFAYHNLINDPPFTNIDFISCRNLMIYLQTGLQQKVIDLFNFSLNPNGILLLGKSESVGKISENYQQLHPKYKIFRFMGSSNAHFINKGNTEFPRYSGTRKPLPSTARAGIKSFEESRILERFLQTLYGSFLPACIIVNESKEILHSIGDISEFLTLPQGKLVNDITKMATRDLAIPIATGLQKLFNQSEEIKYTNISLHKGDRTLKINLLLKPILQKRGQQNLAALFFEISDDLEETPAQPRRQNYDMDQEIKQRILDLEQELQFTRENLQATIEELETSNEELQATNEELLSSNEELQSTNEELQSVNEELYTVNSEYQEKITELTELNNDINNLMDSTEIATIFLDENLDIRKITPEAKLIFNFDEKVIGTSMYKYSNHLKSLDLINVIKSVMENDQIFEKSILCENGNHYMVKIKPYKISYKVYSGVIITFINITKIKKLNEKLEKHIIWMDAAAELAKVGGWEIDPETGKTYWTREIYRIHEVDENFDHNVEVGVNFYHPDDQQRLEAAVRACLTDGMPFDLECRFIGAKGTHKIVRSIGKAEYKYGKISRVFGSFQDITERKQQEEEIRATQRKYENLIQEMKSGKEKLS